MSVELLKKSDEQLKRERALRDLTKSFCGIEKPLKGCITHIETLNDLIRELHVVFSSDYVNIELVNHLMMVYTSNYNDWKKFGKHVRNFFLTKHFTLIFQILCSQI